jgi:hypothetical protein
MAFGKAIFGGSGQEQHSRQLWPLLHRIPGLAAGIMYAVPPFGYNYLSPAPPLLATPFITAATGNDNGQRFPFPFPSHSVSASNPDNSINWANFVRSPPTRSSIAAIALPYLSNYMLSIQRQLRRSPADRQLRRQPGSPRACAGLRQPRQRRALPQPRQRRLRPLRRRQHLHHRIRPNRQRNPRGTKRSTVIVAWHENYGENTADKSIANSNYNALETTLRYNRGGSQFLLSYTYAKSIDQGSNLGEQLNPSMPARAAPSPPGT